MKCALTAFCFDTNIFCESCYDEICNNSFSFVCWTLKFGDKIKPTQNLFFYFRVLSKNRYYEIFTMIWWNTNLRLYFSCDKISFFNILWYIAKYNQKWWIIVLCLFETFNFVINKKLFFFWILFFRSILPY